jgi:hypothetical protein
MRNIIVSALLAGAALGMSVPAQAAVVIGGFTFDTGSFGAQTGVHSSGSQSGPSLNGFVSKGGANNGVTFSTTTGNLSITGSGEATINGDPGIENLTVLFQKAWDSVTFNFEGDTSTTFSMLVNGSTLFSGAGCSICNLGGNGKFTLSGTGITSLTFNFDPAINAIKQFRVEGVSNIPAVPEPTTWAMIIGGLGLVGVAMRRRATNLQFS